MMKSPLSLCLPLACLLLPCAHAQDSAPQPTPTHTLHRDVTLVTLDGVALDNSGKVVRDLKPSEFHITEDSVPQTVRYFRLIGTDLPPADAAIDSTADLERLAPRAPVNLVVLDEYSVHFEDMAFARYSLKTWLQHQPDKLDTPTMLIAVNLDHFTVVRDYTQDKAAILAALDKHLVEFPWKLTNGAWKVEEIQQTHETLRRIAEATASHAGHKNILWLGRGFPEHMHFSHELDEEHQHDSLSQHTVDELRAARATLYTIDPAGVMMDPRAYASNPWQFIPGGGGAGFERLAYATGGLALHGNNDVQGLIATAVHDGANFYSISYTPTNSSKTDIFRHVEVKLDRPGVTFYANHGYYPARTAGKARSADGMLFSEMLNAANSNMQYGGVPFRTGLLGSMHAIGVHIQGQGIPFYFAEGDKPRFTRILVLVKTTDAKGKQLSAATRSYEFYPSTADADSRNLDLPLEMGFPLPDNAAATHARIVVRVEQSGRMGTADLELQPNARTQSVSYTPGLKEAAALTATPQTAAPKP